LKDRITLLAEFIGVRNAALIGGGFVEGFLGQGLINLELEIGVSGKSKGYDGILGLNFLGISQPQGRYIISRYLDESNIGGFTRLFNRE